MKKPPVSTMIADLQDSIAKRYTYVLRPQSPSKHFSNYLPVFLDTEYVLPIHNPYSPEQLKEEHGITELPPEFTQPRPAFRTFQLGCQGKVTHWKADRPISSTELCSWILANLAKWEIDVKKYTAIAVCCHYLLAEVQHLTDVEEKFKKWGSTLYGEIEFEPDAWDNFNPYEPDLTLELDKVKFLFIDTYTIFGMSLEKLTQDTPFPKRKDDYEWHGKPWKYWRAHPDQTFQEDEAEFWKYADGDCLALEWSLLHWRKWIWERWKIDILRTKTFSSIGLRILKQKLTEPIEPYMERKYTDKNKDQKIVIVFDWSKKYLRDFFLDGYWGGRREVDERGYILGPVYAYDVSKEYTTAAIMQPLPNAHTNFLTNELEDSDDLDRYEGIIEARFEFPKEVDYPNLPVYDLKFKKLIFPRKGVTACGVAEIRFAKKLGAKIWIIQSCVFQPTPEEINHPLRQMLEEVLGLANKGKGKPQEKFMKNIANGVIGKFIQRNKTEQAEQRWKDIPTVANRSSWSPIWASLILSRARAIYAEILTLGTPVYGHTDSMFSRTPIDLNAPILQKLREYGSEGLKLENEFDVFWTPRSAVYYGRTKPDKDGKTKVRTARHGIRGQQEDFIKTIEPKLGSPDAPNRTVFTSLKMATFKDKNLAKDLLGHEIVTITDTDFEFDHKRKLLNPNAKLWSESSKTRPWESIEEILNEVHNKKGRTLAEGFKQATGHVGRPKAVTEEDRLEMEKLLKEGLTRYKIAQKFRPKYSKPTVYEALGKKS